RVVSLHAVVVSRVGVSSRVRVAGHARAYGGDLGKVHVVCGTLELEAIFVGGKIAPSEVDLAGGDGRRSEIGGGARRAGRRGWAAPMASWHKLSLSNPNSRRCSRCARESSSGCWRSTRCC